MSWEKTRILGLPSLEASLTELERERTDCLAASTSICEWPGLMSGLESTVTKFLVLVEL